MVDCAAASDRNPQSDVHPEEPALWIFDAHPEAALRRRLHVHCVRKEQSKSKVRAFRLNVTALDCPTQDGRSAGCEVAGHGDRTFTVDIPPGEVRQINGEFNLLDVPNPNGAGFSPRFAVRAVLAPLDEAEDTSDDDILAKWNYKCENVK